jgi:hypothetical protein
MNIGNDDCPSHTRGWYHTSSLKGVPRCLPRSGVPQTVDAKCAGPRALKQVADVAVAMIGAWIRSRKSRESEQATHDDNEDPVPAPGQDSEEASPT